MKKKIVGKKEYLSLPELNLKNIVCKIDTGAYTSALHCKDIKILENNMVEFLPLDESYYIFGDIKRVSFPIHKQKYVKSSNGKRELRYYIKTYAYFSSKKYPITLSLTNRSSMKNPILIGRKFLEDKFIVDVSHNFLQQKKEAR